MNHTFPFLMYDIIALGKSTWNLGILVKTTLKCKKKKIDLAFPQTCDVLWRILSFSPGYVMYFLDIQTSPGCMRYCREVKTFFFLSVWDISDKSKIFPGTPGICCLNFSTGVRDISGDIKSFFWVCEVTQRRLELILFFH